jgi:hypothetical protein
MSPAPTNTADVPETTVTVIAALPLFPSLVAVIVAEPAAAPVTTPLEFTVAADGLLLVHVTVLPESALPLASFGVAVNCTVCPTWRLAVAGLTATEVTDTGVTMTAELPVRPPLEPVIVADPAVTPVTRPLELTVATAPLLLAQVTVWPDTTLPLVSVTVAASWTVWPWGTVADAGATVTDPTATGHVTATLAASDLPPGLLVAVTV